MTDDDERRCCSQPCYDLLVNLGLLKPNTSMSASLLPSFDSRRDQLQTDEGMASPRQHAQDEANPVLLDYDYMPMTERPANSLERMLITRHARTLPSAVMLEHAVVHVEQQPTDHVYERQEPAEFDPNPDTLR